MAADSDSVSHCCESFNEETLQMSFTNLTEVGQGVEDVGSRVESRRSTVDVIVPDNLNDYNEYYSDTESISAVRNCSRCSTYVSCPHLVAQSASILLKEAERGWVAKVSCQSPSNAVGQTILTGRR